MKSEAVHFAKSFEHSPKASKQLNYIIFNDSNGENVHFEVKIIFCFKKNVGNQFLHMILYVKNYAGFDGNVHFA